MVTKNIQNGFVWVVGQKVPGPHVWQMIAITTNEELAIGACIDDTYFIGPFPINTVLPSDTVNWEGSYNPVKERGKCQI